MKINDIKNQMVSFNCLCLIFREKTAKPSLSFLSPIYFFLWELQFFLAFLLNPWASVTISTITILSVLLLILHYLSSWTFSDFNNFLCETSRVTQLCWTKLSLGLPKAGPQGWRLQDDNVSTLQWNIFLGCVHCSEFNK